MIESIYLWMLLVCHTIGFFSFITINNTASDRSVAALAYFIIVLTTMLVFPFYKYRVKNRIYKRHVIIEVNHSYFDKMMFVLLVANIIYSVSTGAGTAETYVQTSYSVIFSLLYIKSIIWVYYFSNRENYCSKLFIINIILYLALQLLQGWSGVIIYLFLFEMYFYFKRKGLEENRLPIKAVPIIFLIVLLAIIGGGILYSYIFTIKYKARGYNAFTNSLSWAQGINQLVYRLTYFNSSAKSIILKDRICNLYLQQQNPLIELEAFFRPLVPRSLMPDKLFRSMGSCIYTGTTGIYNINITDNAGIVDYGMLLLNCNVEMFIIWILLLFFCFKFTVAILRCFEEYEGQYNMLIFQIIVDLIAAGNLETQFSQTYIKLLFFIFFMWILGIVKIYIIPSKGRTLYNHGV